MIWTCVLVYCLAAVVHGKPNEGCVVGEWSEMGAWTSPSCQHSVTESGPDAGYASPHGSENRLKMMEVKRQAARDMAACKRDPECTLKETQSMDLVNCVGGMAGEFECSNVNLLSLTGFGELCGADCGAPLADITGADLWGWVDPVTQDEYAIMNMNMGTTFVRVTDPENPVVLAYMPGTAGTTIDEIWRDVKVMNNYAFVGSEYNDHGIQIFDLTRLRSMNGPREIVQPDTTYMDIGNSHNVVMSPTSNTLFVVGATTNRLNLCRGGPFAVDVTDPMNPVRTGCFGDDDYTHDAECVLYNGPDTRYAGREICFNYDEEDLVIADVTDKANMVLLSKVNYLGNEYTHQGWITEDQSLLLLDDELDEYYSANGTRLQRTHLWDISDLENPVLVNTYWASFESIDHNLYILGDLAFEANYEAGLRILRITQDPPRLTEVAYFDVYPEPTTVWFTGAWTAYPYLPSGNIILSSIDRGLFVLQPDYAVMEQQYQDSLTYRERTRTRPVLYASEPESCPATVQKEREIVTREC